MENVADEVPTFATSSDSVTINENSPPSLQIYRVSAFSNGEPVLYSYNTVKTAASTISKFRLSPIFGTIRLSDDKLDYETAQEYYLHIRATNFQNSVLVSEDFTLQVLVTDKNDNAPAFASSSYSFSVVENLPSGTTVGTVSATDNDGSKAFNTVSYLLLNEEFKTLFNVESTTGLISTRAALNREEKDSYKLTVCATDKTATITKSFQTCTIVYVSVTNVDEGPPLFQQGSHSIQVPRSILIGFELFTFKANDPDKTPVIYELEPKTVDESRFSLNASTGQLKLASSLQSDSKTVYSVFVTPKDSATSVKGLPAELKIKVFDSAPEEPAFEKSFYSFNVNENLPIDSLVGTVRATSLRAGAVLAYYTLVGAHSDEVAVNPATGSITTKQVFDYETVTFKKFGVTVCVNDTTFPGKSKLNH